MLAFEANREIELLAEEDSTLVMFGGAPITERYLYWNFVSSSRERLERAKEDWRENRFAPVPGDDERIPLPDLGGGYSLYF